MRPGKLLIVDDEERIRNILATILRESGCEIETARDGFEAVEISKKFDPEVLIIDLQMPRMNGIETFSKIREIRPDAVAIILTAHGTIQTAVDAIKKGVYDYISKPFDNDQILLIVKRAIDVYRLTEEVGRLKGELAEKYGVAGMIGSSPAMGRVKEQIMQMSGTDATVLIDGESGTGKELAARAIHHESRRRDAPFVIVDCAAVPPGLIESEFFGHEKGAFTDARERRAGKFEEAHTGSVFLDEIGELPMNAQVRLLRVLQEKEFTRVGGTSPIRVDVRILAATNKNLSREVSEGRFREDLYYRLNVIHLTIPPLRDHREDIPQYADGFIRKHAASFGKKIEGISEESLRFLRDREWRGNIREFENAIQRALLGAAGTRLEVGDFGFMGGGGETGSDDGMEAIVRRIAERAERELIARALEETGGNRTAAAEKLKISRKTLFNKMRQYGFDGRWSSDDG